MGRSSLSRVVGVVATVIVLSTGLAPQSASVVVPGTNGLLIFETATDLRTVRADGIGEVVLTGSTAADNDPAFAPNQAFFVFENGGNIFRANPDGANRTQLTTSGGNSEPQVHPDGSRIVYAKATGIFEVPAAGGPESQVNGTLAGDNSPDYAPNPDKVFSASGGLYRTNGSGARTHIQGTVNGDDNPAVSADKMWLYFNASGGTLYRVPYPNGGPRTQVLDSSSGLNPAPSADSSRVAWSNGSRIFIANTDGLGGRTELPLSISAFDVHWGSLFNGSIPPIVPPPGTGIVFDADVPCGSVLDLHPWEWLKLGVGASEASGRDVTLSLFGDTPHIAFTFPHLPKTRPSPEAYLFTKPLFRERGSEFDLGFRASFNGTVADCPYTIRVIDKFPGVVM